MAASPAREFTQDKIIRFEEAKENKKYSVYHSNLLNSVSGVSEATEGRGE